MTDLECPLPLSHIPEEWLVIADWYEEHSDLVSSREWKERATIGRQLLDAAREVLTTPPKHWYQVKVPIRRMYVELWNGNEKAEFVHATLWDERPSNIETYLEGFRIDPIHLRRCIDEKDPGKSSEQVARFLNEIISAAFKRTSTQM